MVTHADEENTPADDVLDHKIAETTATNGEAVDAAAAAVGFELFVKKKEISVIFLFLGIETIIIRTEKYNKTCSKSCFQ